jgi:hypothetical protein
MTEVLFLKAKHLLVEDVFEDGFYLDTTGWEVEDRESFYHFSTGMDNFCMISFLKKNGVKDIEQCYHSNAYDKKWVKEFEKDLGVKVLGD